MRTPLYNEHIKLGAKMVDFAGWELPVLYTSILEEHIATREHAGIFDISHMGEISISGPDAAGLLRKLIPTRLDKLVPGKCMYSCLCNEKAGVIDDLFIYMVSGDEFFVVVNAANLEKDLRWIRDHSSGDTVIKDLSEAIAKIDLQGPDSGSILERVLPDGSINGLERFFFRDVEYRGEKIMVSCSGYTGEKGYELYLSPEAAPEMWTSLLEAGRGTGLIPVGLGARDSLRIEACYSLYGHELTDEITPVEAGIGWIVSSKEEYIGHDIVRMQKKDGAPREIITLECTGRGIPREGYRVQKDGEDVGFVTSGVFSPLFKKGIALALVKSGSVSTGDNISVIIRDKEVAARAVERPFYSFNA